MSSPPSPRVLVLGAPASRGRTLARLSDLAARAWREAGATVMEVEAPNSLPRRIIAHAPGLNSAESSWLSRQLRNDEAIDLVHVIDAHDAPAAMRLPGQPQVLVTVHAMPTLAEYDGARPRGRAGAILRALREADFVVATSQYVADELATALNRVVSVLHPPIDPLHGDRAARSTFHPPAWPYLLVVADGGPDDGRIEAIHAWTQLRRTASLDGLSLVVAGDPLTPTEEAMVTACGGHSSVFSDSTAVQLGALYSRARAVLAMGQPSSFPWTVIEAHQARRPVLARDHELFVEAGGQGCVYVPVEGMTRFDPHTWSSISEDLTSSVVAERANQNAEAYTWPQFVNELAGYVDWGSPEPVEDDATAVDLSRLDVLLETSPWAAPPLDLAQLSEPITPAPWDLPSSLEAEFYGESLEDELIGATLSSDARTITTIDLEARYTGPRTGENSIDSISGQLLAEGSTSGESLWSDDPESGKPGNTAEVPAQRGRRPSLPA